MIGSATVKVTFIICFVGIIKGQLKVNDEETGWTDASKSCRLAKPMLNYGTNDITATMMVDDEDGIDDEGAWIGYKRVYRVFQYVGCFDNMGTSPNFTTVDIGSCFSACKAETSDVIGFESSSCFCFQGNGQDRVKVTAGGCFKGFISLYGTVDDEFYDDVKDNTESMQLGDCVLAEGGQNYKWTKCSTSHTVACVLPTGDVLRFETETKTWLESIKKCVSQDSMPLSKDVSFQGKSWTGMLRSKVIVVQEDTTGRQTDYVFVQKNSSPNSYFLGYDSSRAEKEFICDTGATTVGSTSMVKSTDNMATVNPVESRESGSASAYIGIAVGIVLLIAIVCVIIIVLIRKKRICADKVSNKHVKLEAGGPRINAESASAGYADVDLDQAANATRSSRDYDVVRETIEKSGTQSSGKNNEGDMKANQGERGENYSYATVAKLQPKKNHGDEKDTSSTYDVCNHGQKGKEMPKPESDHVYSHMAQQPDNEALYNKTGESASRPNQRKSPELYDTTDNCKNKLNENISSAENNYDKSSNFMDIGNQKKEVADSDYDHAFQDGHRTNAEENVYDKAGSDKRQDRLKEDPTYDKAKKASENKFGRDIMDTKPQSFYV